MIKPHLTPKCSKLDGTFVQSEHDSYLHEPPAFVTKTSLSEYFGARPMDTLEDVIAQARSPDNSGPI